MVRWLEESTHKANHQQDVLILRRLDARLGGKYLDEITRDLVEEIAGIRKAGGVSNITVNHTIQVIRVILRRAGEQIDG